MARRLRWYRKSILSRLTDDHDGYLFVAKHGALKDQGTLTDQIISVIEREVAIHMTVHKFRHFAAVAYLEENPEDFETPRSFLGHAFSKTTRLYAGSQTRRAWRAYTRFFFESRNRLNTKAPRKRRFHKPRKRGSGS